MQQQAPRRPRERKPGQKQQPEPKPEQQRKQEPKRQELLLLSYRKRPGPGQQSWKPTEGTFSFVSSKRQANQTVNRNRWIPGLISMLNLHATWAMSSSDGKYNASQGFP